MDALNTYSGKTTVATFMVNSARTGLAEFTSLSLPFGPNSIYTPIEGVTTIRMAACAVEMEDPTVGTVRIDVAGMPVSGAAVVQQVSSSIGTTLGYIPVEFGDRASEAEQTAQPVVQLYPGVQLLDMQVSVRFKPLQTAEETKALTSLNMILVMETDGTSSGNTSVFQI